MLAIDNLANVPSWLKPPTWRWTTAVQLASSCTEQLPTERTLQEKGLPKDNMLLMAARYYTLSYRPQLGGMKVARVKYPNMYRCTLIFKGEGHFRFWKTALESMFLTELSLKDIAYRLGVGEDIRLLKTYKDIFFDVDSYKQNEACIQLNIMSMECRGEGLEATGEYLSKLTAYSRGFDTFYRLFIGKTAYSMSDEDADWLQNMIKTRMGMKAANLVCSTRTDYLQQHLDVLKTGQEWLIGEGVDTDALGKKAKSEAVSQLLATVHSACDKSGETSSSLTDGFEDYANIEW